MAFFRKKKKDLPRFPEGDYKPVQRCSICTGERVLCARERSTGKIHELMLIRSDDELEDFCRANAIAPESVRRIY